MRSWACWRRGCGACGHRTHTSGIRLNVDCSAAATARLEQRLEEFVEKEGEPAVVIGQSRGGLFARVLGVRRPDLVHSIVTLGSPHNSTRWRSTRSCGSRARRSRAWAPWACPGFATHRCRNGDCCARVRHGPGRARCPRACGSLSIYSKRDGIVDWPACLDPHAVHLEVRSTHCGMGVNPAVYELLDSELHAPRPQARRRRPGGRARRGLTPRETVRRRALVLQRAVPICRRPPTGTSVSRTGARVMASARPRGREESRDDAPARR